MIDQSDYRYVVNARAIKSKMSLSLGNDWGTLAFAYVNTIYKSNSVLKKFKCVSKIPKTVYKKVFEVSIGNSTIIG